jgi:hypothetical protein
LKDFENTTKQNQKQPKESNTHRSILFILEKQPILFTKFPIKKINVRKILKLGEIFVLLFFLLTS